MTSLLGRMRRQLRTVHINTRAVNDRGMATVEYAMVTIGAAAFAAVLVAIIRSPEVRQALGNIISQALGGA